MNKIKKYNQKLLAIIGTLVLLGIILLTISIIAALIANSFYRTTNMEIRDNSLTLNNELEEENKVEIKKQDVTFENARLIDTLNTLYLIPVSQVNIDNKINTNDEESILISGGRRGSSYQKTSFHKYSGKYNNILLYNQSKSTKDFLFNKKVYISEFLNRIIDSTHYLLITGATKDSNNDNKLNHEDLKSFFVYDIKNKKLFDFTVENHGFVDFYNLYDTNKLLLRFAIDKNKDGEINYLQEPVIIKELDFGNMELNDFISSDKINELTEVIN